MIPNAALLIWPLISLILFAGAGFKRGLILSVVIGYLFLPSNFKIDLPALPGYHKLTAITLGLVLGYLFFSHRRKAEVGRLHSENLLIGRLLIAALVIYMLTPTLSFLTNREPLFYGPKVVAGLRLWDAISITWDQMIFIVPFLMGWRLLSKAEDQALALKILVGAGLMYSFLALFELRMSPQLNNWIYGYFPHQWIQHVRGGGYRPLVFLGHGLVLGLFLLATVLSAAALSRAGGAKQRYIYLLAMAWLFAVLMLSRNFGALLIAMTLCPLALIFGPAQQVRFAAVIAIIFLFYPIVRQAELLPINGFLNLVQSISPERANSFMVRLQNEQEMLVQAQGKPIFGWGGYGRNRIFDEAGNDVSLVDGLWISVLGTRGWVGYITLFGIVTLPVLWLGLRRQQRKILPVTAGIAMILTGNLVDLIPNSTLSPITMLLMGALAGYVQFAPAEHSEGEKTPALPSGRTAIRYSRFEPQQRS
ncbi:MAG: hypothetical protein QNJ20_00020 [Paracoccaceae bacterium]|nr:hypothetical protein [Paracoccaceae bacterium]